jgi:hypothetical protein
MPINSFLYPGAKVTLAYEVANSCRFDDGSSDNLTRTPSGDGNMRTWTYSGWVKLGNLGVWGGLIFAGIAGSTDNLTDIYFYTDNKLYIRDIVSNGVLEAYISPNRVFRDPNAWMHIVVAFDTTQGTASNRIKLYINGVQETSLSESTYPSENYQTNINDASYAQQIGISKSTGGSSYYFDGYMAEVVLIDGQALDPTSFGEFDSNSPNIWKPIDVSGLTFGTNGFYLDFENASNLGADVSGNSNNFTVNNLTSVDQSTDTCTNNYATLNALVTYPSTPPVHSEGNLQVVTVNADPGYFGSSSTIGVTQGKWYAEFKPTNSTSGVPYLIGVSSDPAEMARNGATSGNQYSSTEWTYYGHNGNQYHDGSNSSYGNSYTTNDIIGVALDLDNHKLYFSKNGTFQNSGDPTSGSTGTGAISIDTGETYFFILTDLGGAICTYQANFGSPPFSISSGNSDANGYGNFEYSVPSGYYSINTKNLAEFG